MSSPFEEFRRKRETEEIAAREQREKERREHEAGVQREQELKKRKDDHYAHYGSMVSNVLSLLREAAYPNPENKLLLSHEYEKERSNYYWSIGYEGLDDNIPFREHRVEVRLNFDIVGNPTGFTCRIAHGETNSKLTEASLVSVLTQLQKKAEARIDKTSKQKKGLFGRLF